MTRKHALSWKVPKANLHKLHPIFFTAKNENEFIFFTSSDEDEDFKNQVQDLRESIPFAVVGANALVEIVEIEEARRSEVASTPGVWLRSRTPSIATLSSSGRCSSCTCR